MAANKFATMVHKNTNRITLILIYVLLEWILIAMLLLNALFSYLILRFSQFFGLKPPCILCSRIDHVFGSKIKKNFYRDLLCQSHVTEFSQLGEFGNFCGCCSITKLERDNGDFNFEKINDFSDAQKGDLVFEADLIRGSDEFREIKLGFEKNIEDCSVPIVEGDKFDLDVVVEDHFPSENEIISKIEKCDDANFDKYPVFEPKEMVNENNPVLFQTKICDFVTDVCEQADPETMETVGCGSVAGEAYHQMSSNELEEEDDVSIGTEIPDIEATEEIHNEEAHIIKACGINQVEEEVVEFKTISIDATNYQTSLDPEFNDIDEEKIPDTPSSVESLQHLYKKLLLLDEKESRKEEESFDGSVMSDLEGDEGIMSVEKLMSVLRAERKALNELFMELEEERCANAIAANQTMAMINRLQEEKAAMEMEALQYQRMMEEQSQYDQEALHMLNELMVRREKEKQELEKELENFRKRVPEKTMSNGAMSESQCFSSSNCGDSDESSIDLYREDHGDECFDEEKGCLNTSAQEILNADDLASDFEEERLLILDHLKHLEEKLFAFADDEEEQHHCEEPIENLYKENDNANGYTKEMNGNHKLGRRIMGIKGRRLLPLFDAMVNGNIDENGDLNGLGSDMLKNSVSDSIERNYDVEVEFDRLYKRLQALEANKDFLQYCFRSLKKGGKGVDLLREILQLLRYMKGKDLQGRNLSKDGFLQSCF